MKSSVPTQFFTSSNILVTSSIWTKLLETYKKLKSLQKTLIFPNVCSANSQKMPIHKIYSHNYIPCHVLHVSVFFWLFIGHYLTTETFRCMANLEKLKPVVLEAPPIVIFDLSLYILLWYWHPYLFDRTLWIACEGKKYMVNTQRLKVETTRHLPCILKEFEA